MKVLPSLGNDIVDFSSLEAKRKWTDSRFLLRVFTTQEQQCILNANDQSAVFWSLWAAKEAAYKALKKVMLPLVFSHQQFAISQVTLNQICHHNTLHSLQGYLNYQQEKLALHFNWLDAGGVHCMALLGGTDFSRVRLRVGCEHEAVCHDATKLTDQEMKSVYSKQSLQLRLLAKQFLKDLGYDDHVELIRPVITRNKIARKGPPMLYRNQKRLNDDQISLSHDGAWLAVAVIKSGEEH